MPTRKQRAQQMIAGGLEIAMFALKPESKRDVAYVKKYLTEIFEGALTEVLATKDEYKDLQISFGVKGKLKQN